MAERKESVRVTAEGSDFLREYDAIKRKALEANAAIRAIPNKVTVRADTSGLNKVERDAQRAQRSSSLLLDSVALLAPTIAPLSAVAVAGFGAMAAQGAAALGAIAPLLLATNGMGDALTAIQKARIDPTVENLQKAEQALSQMPAQAADFTRRLDSLRPLVGRFQQTSAEGLFPGLSDGLDALLTRAPAVERIIGQLAQAQGLLASRTGNALAGPEFDAFFEMVERDAQPTLLDLGSTIGSLGTSLANVAVGLAPLNREIGAGIADWAANLERLSANADYEGFMEYVRANGPQVIDTLGALGGATLDIAQAAGALGGPTLVVIEATANALSAIADSPAGPTLFAAAAGFAALNRVLTVQARLRDSLAANVLFGGRGGGSGAAGQVAGLAAVRSNLTRTSGSIRQFRTDVSTIGTTWATAGARSQRESARVAAASSRVRSSLSTVGRGAAPIAALAVATSGVADGIGLANTATLGLAGSMAGPLGAAAGATVGAFLDLKAAGQDVVSVLEQANAVSARTPLADLQAQQAAVRRQMRESRGNVSDDIAAVFSGNADYSFLTGTAGAASDSLASADRRLKAQIADTSAQNRAAAALSALAQGYTLTGSAADTAADGIAGVRSELAASDASFGRFTGMISYRSAILDATDALKQNGQTLDVNTRAGQGNRAALAAVASQARNYVNNMQDAGRASVFLEQSRARVIRLAQSMGASRFEAARLADQLGLVSRARVNPKVNVDTETALAKKRRLEAELRKLSGMVSTPEVRAATERARAQLAIVQAQLNALRDRTVNVTTVFRQLGTPPTRGAAVARADGGTIPGPRYPYRDKILAYLAPGEEVITNRNGEADRFRRDRAAGRIPAYADGGMVQAYRAGAAASSSPRVSVGSPSVSVGGAVVQVLIDGREVEAIVREVQAADALHASGARVSS